MGSVSDGGIIGRSQLLVGVCVHAFISSRFCIAWNGAANGEPLSFEFRTSANQNTKEKVLADRLVQRTFAIPNTRMQLFSNPTQNLGSVLKFGLLASSVW